MTMFQQFRLWARRAPRSERAAAFVGAGLALALLIWLIVPTRGPSSSANAESTQTGGLTSTTDAAASSTTTTSTTAIAGVSSSGSDTSPSNDGAGGGTTGGAKVTATTSVSSSGATGAGCVSPPGTDQGLTSSQIDVAVILINLAGAGSNAVAGTPSPQQQQTDFEDVFNSINASGGVACRKVAATYYSPNIADESQLQQTCLQITQSKPFAVIDLGAFSFFPEVASCIPQNQLPLFSGLAIPQSLQSQYYPYYFSLGAITDTYYRNTAFALKQLGFFNSSNGFTKLGIAYRDCTPQYLGEFEGWLNQLGVPSSQIVTFDDGCPTSAITPPNVTEQTILTFKEDNVSNVTFLDNEATFEGGFTEIAQQQGFNPKYGFPDDGEVATSSGSGPVNWQNLNGAIAITTNSYGQNTTPGLGPSPGTVACDAIYAKYGGTPVYQSPDGIGGAVCEDASMFSAAVDHAPVMQRNALAAGLQAAGSFAYSYPLGPNNFTGNHATTGGEYWRPIQADASCSCWHAVNPNFSPSFP